jgi:hypothetical protein
VPTRRNASAKTDANIESNGVGTHPGHVLLRGVCGIKVSERYV